MKSRFIKLIAVICCAFLICSVIIPEPVNVSAATAQEKYNAAQKALNDAKKKKDAQGEIKKALEILKGDKK